MSRKMNLLQSQNIQAWESVKDDTVSHPSVPSEETRVTLP